MNWLVAIAAIIAVPVYGVATIFLMAMSAMTHDAGDTVSRRYRIQRGVIGLLIWSAWLGIGFAFLVWCSTMLRS